MFELVFLTGARAGQVVPVTKTLLAGRSPECSLEVPDPNTSRQHSRVIYDGVSCSVADNGSSNGTYLNDVRLTSTVKLTPGDIIRLGETRIRFQAKKRTSGGDSTNASSIFSIKEAEEDLSQSILLRVEDLAKKADPAVLGQRLSAIIKVSKALVNINKIDQVFDGILETLFEVFPQADRGFLMIGEKAERLEPKAMRSRGKGVTENLHVSMSICKKAMETRTAILFDDQKSNDFNHGMSIVSLKIRSAMTIPLMVNEDVLGLLQIDTPEKDKAFTKDDLELALAVSQQAAIALHNALLLSKVEHETTVRNNLMRFLPGPLVDQALNGQFDLGGRTCNSTILFSDVVGFTRLSEALHPEQVVSMMNDYFSRMLPCIEAHSGSVDKFLGDAIIAVWGIPIDKGDSAINAVQAALAMQCAMSGLNSLNARDGKPQLGMGIGVNTGQVVAGNIGAETRKEYTVLGDAVNTAQRVESAAGRHQVYVSEASWRELGGRGFGLLLPPLHAKNKSEPLTVFCLRGLKIMSNEVMLHLPCTSNGTPVLLIRRLNDNTFLMLHPSEFDPCAAPLTTSGLEWPDVDLGTPTMESVLPGQLSDGLMIRSQVRLADPTLKGLLGDKPLTCDRDWAHLNRS
ncbi:MAG TPA: adenylate/guanylate cyclase domain-containing protein [Planctomycetota bacterium]|nr:adenylate/guanylate cyclase domain-containing protein [Planctomycetota bacterium]